MTATELFVLGRFPPPFDGQTLATRQCAEFLDAEFEVVRVNTEPDGYGRVDATPRFEVGRTARYLQMRRKLCATLGSSPRAPVLWHSISPAPLGHLRDRVITLPSFASAQPVAAVLHRALYEQLVTHRLLASSARYLLSRMQAVVFQSRTLADRTAPWIESERRWIIPNTISNDLLFSREEVVRHIREYCDDGPLQLLFLSNMLPEKGYREVILAARELNRRGIDFRLTLAGKWPSEYARREGETLSVGLPIDIIGPVEPLQARALHARADIFLLPTFHPSETQPIAIIEALGAGTPVISVDREVIRDMISDGIHGALVPPRNSEAIARAVMRLATPEAWRQAALAARDRFEQSFAPDIIASEWRRLANELIRTATP